MRIPFLILFFTCLLCNKAWAQPRCYPLSWEAIPSSNARIEATTTPPYTTTLQLPYFYDFASKYLQIDSIINGSPVTVVTQRPHGLKTYDSVEINGVKLPTLIADFTGVKIVKRLSDYRFKLYNDASLSSPVSSIPLIDYLRINKLYAKETVRPDTLAFYYNNGGTQVVSGSAKNQPSYYVARFDGLDEKGVPYSTSTFAVGYTDSLRSQTFDFSSYSPSSNIYMSFYYQHGGYGEQPDAIDHLYLEFLDTTLQWNTVQDLTGVTGKSPDVFYKAMVPVSDPKYLHAAFQYRFRSYGRQSGAYDVWNLDYIYIDKNRTAADTTIRDYAIRNGDQSFLNGYTAMPFNHFFKGNKATTVYFNRFPEITITNQDSVNSKDKIVQVVVMDQFKHVDTTDANNDQALYNDSTYIKHFSTISFPTQNKPIYVDLIHCIEDSKRVDAAITPFPSKIPTLPLKPSLDMMFNNVVSKRTYLYDYYAYDDGEAESGFGSNFSGAEIAYRFVSGEKDTLTHIDICFTRNKDVNLENSQIYLMVWRDTLSTDPNLHSELYKQPISVHYPSSINGFVRYPLTTPIVIDSAAKFHIGFKKNFPQLLTVGYDRNNLSVGKCYYKESTQWAKLDSIDDIGSMMMRPVFYEADNNVPVPIHPSTGVNKNALLLYPNPASTTIDIVATEEISNLNYVVYSLYGQIMDSGVITSTAHTINIATLSGGMYLILCTDAKGKTYSTRFIK